MATQVVFFLYFRDYCTNRNRKKMRVLSGFWIVYILFFIIGLPLIIHYNVQFIPAQDDPYTYMQKPLYSIICLAIGTLLWITCIILYYWYLIGNVFSLKKKIAKLSLHASQVTATVVGHKVLYNRNGQQDVELTLSFKNFSNTEVQYTLEIIDVKPMEHRYKEGNSISLLIDREIKPPYLHLEKAKAEINLSRMAWLFVGLFAVIGLWLAILIGSYQWESQGYGWRYLSAMHPYVIVPASGLFYFFVFSGIIRRFGMSNTKNDIHLLLKGKRATAEITSLQQTGTYINEQPELRFELEFFDSDHKKQVVTLKKIVSLLHLHQFTVGQQVGILYMPDAPSKIMFYG